MASPTLKELKYRRFDELMDEIYIDLPSFTREGMVEPGQLVKVAQRVNYELGLKIHGTKETILDIEHGKAKLPADFYILNFATLCNHYTVVESGLFNGIHTETKVTPVQNPNSIPQLTSCPCWTVISAGAQCPVTYCDGTQSMVYFPPNDDGSPKTTKLCATFVDVANAHGGSSQVPGCGCYTVTNLLSGAGTGATITSCIDSTTSSFSIEAGKSVNCCSSTVPVVNGPAGSISVAYNQDCYSVIRKDGTMGVSCTQATANITATTSSFCYNDPDSGTLTCDKPEVCGCVTVEPTVDCAVVDTDPWKQNKVYTICNNTQQVNVIEYHSNEVRKYDTFEHIYMVPSKEASSFCVNTRFDRAPHRGYIRDGFLYVPTMENYGEYGTVGSGGQYMNAHEYERCGKVYICYLGAMEDDNGDLLVLDHPKINEYYEWAIKERIFQNIYLNGEPDMERRLQLVQAELKSARAQALSIATMPDFYELKNTIEMNRKAMYYKYLHPFSSLYANTPGWPWAINSEYI